MVAQVVLSQYLPALPLVAFRPLGETAPSWDVVRQLRAAIPVARRSSSVL
jgi:hypothetical protein